jgi:N-acetylglucosaminyldiphosphoundecaprenol N-acetyl-beta-D-mannosaminyltransferase
MRSEVWAGVATDRGVAGAARPLGWAGPERGIERVNILGIGVSAIGMSQALETIERWLEWREQHYVCVTGVHGVMESQRDEALRRIHNRAGLVTPDGVPLVWLSRLNGQHRVEQVCGSDLMLACCERSVVRGYRHFFYGGGEGVAQRLADRLRSRYPGLAVAGTYAPPFRPLSAAEDEAIIRDVNDASPDIVWVGLSTPKQERWMAAHVGRLRALVLIGVGAAFDFHAGLKKRAPRWMQRSGLEWAFRLGTEPRRLWRRYLRNNPAFIWRVSLQAAGIARYELWADSDLR